MAFQNPGFRDFHLFLQSQLSSPPEERALAENFLLEERLPLPRETRYGSPLSSPLEMGRWNNYHQQYINAYVLLKKETGGRRRPLSRRISPTPGKGWMRINS